MSRRSRLLLVNADDFGQHPQVNAAIVAAHTRGILTGASIMAGAPAADEAVALARAHPTLDLGIHLTLTGERAVAPAASLGGLIDAAGRLPRSYPGLVSGIVRGTISLAAVARELHAQIEWVVSRGVAITHLDSHQHLHLLPPILPLVLRLAHEFGGLAVRMPVERACVGAYPAAFVGLGRRAEWMLLSTLALRARARAAAAGIRFAPRFHGMWASGALSADLLLAFLASPGAQPREIICHPALHDGALDGCRPAHYRGALELAALTDARVRDRVIDCKYRPGTFSDL